MEPFKMRKKCKEKDLIWHMVGEMVKKQGRARLYISCNYSCTSYFLVKILLLKLKNLPISTCLKLNYCIAKQKLQRWWNLSKLVTDTFANFGIVFNSIILSPLKRIMIKTCGRVLVGGMNKNEQTQFFDSQMYLQ